MARQKHFPTLREYAQWVLKQSPQTILGTAFNGIQYPYELFLSEYYGTQVIIIAGDCYEMKNHRYDLPEEWNGFTVGYHDADLSERWEAMNAPQAGIEVTVAQEVAYLRALLGKDVVPVQLWERQNVQAEAVVSIPGMIRATVKVLHTQQEIIHCVARFAMPEYGLQDGECFDLVRSSSNDGTYYLVVELPVIGRTCTCPGFHFYQRCKHTTAVGERVAARYFALKHASLPNTLVVGSDPVKEVAPLNGRGFHVEPIQELGGALVPLR